MSVVSCNEITGRDGGQDVDSNKRYRRIFQVLTSSPQDGASVVLAHGDIPDFNDVYAYLDDSDPGAPVPVEDSGAVVVDVRAEQTDSDNPCNWTVTVEYAGVDDPTAQPAEVEYSPTRYQQALIEDVNGVPVVNSAGDPFQHGITVDRTRFTLHITKNVIDWDPIAASEFQDTINELPFLAGVHADSPDGFLPGTCKLTMSGKRIRRAGTSTFYWQVRHEVDIDLRGWKIKPRDAGFNELYYVAFIPVGKKEIQLPTGGKPSTPQLLDGTGLRLAIGGTPVVAGPGGAGFDGYETADWSGLSLTY